MLKTRLDKLGTILGTILGVFGFWIFLKTFRRLDPPWNTGQFWKKLHQNMFKTRLDKLGTVLGVFWILKIFQKHFEDSTLHGTLDKKISRKKYPKTCSKHVWTLLWTILGIYGILKIFWFIKSISKTRPSMEHWLKKFSKNLPQNTFKTIFDTFGNDFGHFWSFGNFLKTFRRLDPPWVNTGQKNFSKKLPQNMFKTRLDNFGRFWNLENFLNLYKDIS